MSKNYHDSINQASSNKRWYKEIIAAEHANIHTHKNKITVAPLCCTSALAAAVMSEKRELTSLEQQ